MKGNIPEGKRFDLSGEQSKWAADLMKLPEGQTVLYERTKFSNTLVKKGNTAVITAHAFKPGETAPYRTETYSVALTPEGATVWYLAKGKRAEVAMEAVTVNNIVREVGIAIDDAVATAKK